MAKPPPVPRDAVTLFRAGHGNASPLIAPVKSQRTYRHGALVILNDESSFLRAIHSAYMNPYLERSYQQVTLLHLGKELKRTQAEARKKFPLPSSVGVPIGSKKKLTDAQLSANTKKESKILGQQNSHREKLRSDIIKKSVDSTLGGASSIDVYICSHTNELHSTFDKFGTTYLSRFRLVWNSGCGNVVDGSDWMKTGIKAYIGHKGPLSLSPIWVHLFLQYWVGNHSRMTLDEAVKKANKGTAVFKETQAKVFGQTNLKFGNVK